MTKPNLPVPSDLLKNLATATRPAEQEGGTRTTAPAAKAPVFKVHTSNRPVRSTVAPRSTNRGK